MNIIDDNFLSGDEEPGDDYDAELEAALAREDERRKYREENDGQN